MSTRRLRCANKCKAWDCNLETNQYCVRQWCYVDPENCRYTSTKSYYFPDQNIHFSYGTCGFAAYSDSDNPDWMKEELRTRLGGYPLRIAFPADNAPFLVTEPEGCIGLNCTKTGAYVEFTKEILTEANINWTVVPISNESTAFSPISSYTACVHEVSIGGADLCVGNFWITSSRLKLAPFTTLIHLDSFRLVTFFNVASKSIWDHMETPYVVFSGGLWASICGVMAFTGFALWMVDPHNTNDFGRSASPTGLLRSMYLAFSGMSSGGPVHTAASPAAKVINLV